jgi:hypothetical protein
MSYSKSNIISRRIPSGLGYLPSGTVRAHTVRGGLGGAESCGPNQQWDPNYTYAGITGQCVPKGTPFAMIQGACGAGYVKNAYGYCVPASTPSPGIASSLFSGLMAAFKPPATPTTVYVPTPAAASSGMSKNTMIAIGLGAVGLLAVVMLASKK